MYVESIPRGSPGRAEDQRKTQKTNKDAENLIYIINDYL